MESMKRKIYENVKALCLINNMPIGQIEDTIGKCHGFLSRERGDIGISDVCTIAHVFDVSVQDLLSVDFRKAWEDEKALDRYEGYPYLYTKKDFPLRFKGRMITAMAYIMTPGHPITPPRGGYLETIEKGYHDFGFDTGTLFEAAEESERSCEE